MPTIETIEKLHRKYAHNEPVFELVYTHCQIVYEIAQWCVTRNNLRVDEELLAAACLLHDIGAYVFYDESGKALNNRLYPLHALLGATIIREEGLDASIAGAVETHVLMGLSQAEIVDPNSRWVLPEREFEPRFLEAELLCYADRFHSKHPVFNNPEAFMKRLEDSMPRQAQLFAASQNRFGTPDIAEMAERYGHPVR